MPSHRDTARQFPWDRTPLLAGTDYTYPGGAIAAGWATYATYTVPSARKAAVDALSLAALITGAGAAGTYLRLRAEVVSGGVTMPLLIILVNAAVVGSVENAYLASAGWMLPGDTLNGLVFASAGAIVGQFSIAAKVTECQA